MLRLARLARRPLDRFLHIEAASGILLFVTAAAALAWANSPWAESYRALWHTPVGIRLGEFVFERSLEWFVNDVLMAVFFFVVGMEIRRELHHGELSEWRRAALPAIAALGGMVAPALIYLALAGGPETHAGWGIPTATDIAFAVGVLMLLGERVPPALRVLLLALAVIDDLGAIIVIAFFYSPGVETVGLLVAGLGIAVVLALQAMGVRRPSGYFIPAVVIWAGTYASGIHPTIAGVAIGLLTPVRTWLGAEGFLAEVNRVSGQMVDPNTSSHDLAIQLRKVDLARREAIAPAESLIEALHPWVAFVIMPIFALANAGVRLEAVALEGETLRVAGAVAAALVFGKPIGVVAASLIALRARVALLPRGLTFRHLAVLGVVAGIGFTMSLFVAQLAFDDPDLLSGAKLGVLGASTLVAVLGVGLGRLLPPLTRADAAARSADEAESSTEV